MEEAEQERNDQIQLKKEKLKMIEPEERKDQKNRAKVAAGKKYE